MSLNRAATVFVAVVGFCFANLSHASSAGTVQFTAATAAHMENASSHTIAVTRTGGSSGEAGAVCTAVNGTAKAGTDFQMTSTAVQWASGNAASQNCAFTTLDGTPFGGQKTFTIELTNVTGATLGSTSKTTVSILGNKGGGSVTLSAKTYSVLQNAGSLKVTVERSAGAVGTALVYYATANGTAAAGTNYTAQSGAVLWQGSDTTPKTFTIPISNATPFSGSKTFAIALAAPENVVLGTQTSAIVTITGDSGSSTTSAATVSWNPPTTNTNGTPVTTLTGYHVHYGTTAGSLAKSTAVSGASTTSAEITGLTAGTWYFAVAADAEDGTEGPQSSVGSMTVK